jgi:hypothetical protein
VLRWICNSDSVFFFFFLNNRFHRIKGWYRLNKKLAVARAFGDRRMKTSDPPVLDAEPSVAVSVLSEMSDILVLATDGLWQFVEPKQVQLKRLSCSKQCLKTKQNVRYLHLPRLRSLLKTLVWQSPNT